ncbi:histidine kinase [Paenibacillus sp. ACRRX]|uniref:sensor histidine kinase n=1 Tax=Paenibacillus sp. ACRRX TaxID=2918206 RepID=UPI001EF43CDD|nr:histidine kinase [Paenibacillus sp. ACRRX]MCG7408911.1 histidine kinase [Paenibacillus sp. ACRRX]
MKFRGNLFKKLNLGLALVFFIIVVVYGIAHQRTTAILQDEIRRSSLQKLMLLTEELDSKVRQMTDFQLTLLTDSTVKRFASISMEALNYDRIENRRSIQDKLAYKENTFAQWKSSYGIYSVLNQEMIALDSKIFQESLFHHELTARWVLRRNEPSADRRFYRFTLDGIIRERAASLHATTIVGASFPESNIRETLDRAMEHNRGNTILYHSRDEWIEGSREGSSINELIVNNLQGRELEHTFQYVFKANGQQYLVTGVESDSLNWYMVDSTLLDDAMKPLSVVNGLFYGVLVVLFLLTLSMSYTVYRHVLAPLKTLMRGLKSIQSGQYAVQIQTDRNDEFNFVFDRFNEMSRDMRELIENILMEQLRAKDAYLKQLQAQINPHFLYNCLGFIINMIEMKQDQAAITMAHNLSDYYRYMTRTDITEVMLKDEVAVVSSYLDIQRMRFSRLQVEIDIAESLHSLIVPRLIIQPVVENAIVHGISSLIRPARILIRGGRSGQLVWIEVEDNGKGLSHEQLAALLHAVTAADNPQIGYGLWNVRQRLLYRYAEGADITIRQAELQGLIVRLEWMVLDQNEQYRHPHNRGSAEEGESER